MKLNGTFLSLMICAAAFVCSCKQAVELTPAVPADEDKPAIDETAPALGASLEEPTKTSLKIDGNNGYVLWNQLTDTVLVNGSRYVATEILDEVGVTAKLCLVEGDEDISKDESYTAYYPASIYNSGTSILPAVQKFKAVADGADAEITGDISAIMPMYGEGGNLSVQFYNVLGLLEITLKANASVSKIEVSDASFGMCGAFTIPGAESGDYSAVLANPASKLPVTLDCGKAGVDITGGVKFYVAIPAGTYKDFDIKVYDIYGKVCDLPAFGTAKVKRNEIYPLEFEPVFSEPEYVKIGDLYWATKNIGANNSREYGWYFSWGNTKGYVHNGTNWVEAEDNTKVLNGGFNKTNYDSIGLGHTLAGDIPVDAAYDAARANLGGEWRMPTISEYNDLYNATYWAWDGEGYYVFLPEDAGQSGSTKGLLGDLNPAKAKLFFPAACYGSDKSITGEGHGYYWTSTVHTSSGHASVWTFYKSDITSAHYVRVNGFTVRAVKSPGTLCTIIAKPAAGCEDMGTVSGSDLYPAGSTATLTATPKEGYWFVKWSDGITTPTRTATVTADATYEAVFTDGLLVGKFSVSATDYVRFSKGNLFCTDNGGKASPRYTFGFEKNQYDYRCRNGVTGDKAIIMGTETTTPPSTSGLFEWIPRTNSNATADWGAFTKHSSPVSGITTKDMLDFGGVFSTGGWTTLNSSEWSFLLNNNKNKIITIDGRKGLCIAPYNYDGEINETYTLEQWEAAENAGMVFLPHYGYFNTVNNVIVTEESCYWSSTANDITEYYAQALQFYNGGNAIKVDERWRNYAQDVRLVQKFSK